MRQPILHQYVSVCKATLRNDLVYLSVQKALLLFWCRYWRNCDSSFAPKIYECIALVHRLCQSVPSNNQTPRPFMFLPSSPICRCTAVDISGGLDVIRFLLLCHQRRQRLLLSAAPFEPISQVDGLAIMIHRVATQQYGQSKIHTANW